VTTDARASPNILIFEHGNWYIGQLHCEAAPTMLEPAASAQHADDGHCGDEIVNAGRVGPAAPWKPATN
jgi:hypothetical protein